MKLKKLLGMLALDIKANEIGKIRDVEFEPETGKINKLIISSKKNLMSSDDVTVDYEDVKSIGDYVLVNIAAEEVKATIVDEESEKVELD